MNAIDIPFTDSRHPQWKHGQISSQASKERWAYAAMALVWNTFAQPMFWLVALKNASIELTAMLFAGLFPLIGLGLAYLAVVKWLQWRRFGNLEIAMDPFPGSLGGDVGGMIEIPIAYQAGKTVQVTLSCINLIIRRRRKNSRRSENVLWRERVEASVEPGMRGSRVSFRFSVPAGQPATSAPSDNCIKWVVHLYRKLPGADLDQTFEIPVLDTGTPQQSRRIHKPPLQQADTAEWPEANVVMETTAEGLRLFYPRSRSRNLGFMMLAFGAAFGAVPWLISGEFSNYASGDAFGMIFIVFAGFFVLVFGLIGLFLIGFGLYSLFNSLEVTVSGGNIASTRNFLGFRWQRALARADLQQLRFKINAQQGHGARATVHYRLEAVPTAGRPVCLGDGIKGKPLARRVMKELSNVLGNAEWVEVLRSRARRRANT